MKVLKFSKSFLVAWNIALSLFLLIGALIPPAIDVNMHIFFIIMIIIYWIISIILIKKINSVLHDSINQRKHILFSFGILVFFLIPTLFYFSRGLI
jgi:hypothetical protein